MSTPTDAIPDAGHLLGLLSDTLRVLVRHEVESAMKERQANAPRSYTMKQVEELTSLSRSTLQRMVNRGELKVVHIHRRVLVPADEVERLVAEGCER